jgi:hypothetical protein
MNILLLSNYSIGCVPYYVRRAILQLGHQVFPFSPDHGNEGWTRCSIEDDVNKLVEMTSAPIDLVLIVEASTGTKLFPKGLDGVSTPTAWWGIDTHLNYRWHKEYANLFDVAFFAQKEYVAKAQRYGTNNVFWLPLGCDVEIHSDKKIPRIYDVSFVGNLTPNREQFFHSLNMPIHLVSGAYLEEMARIYSQSKIVLNISAREDLNMRAFEAMCSGALLITQRIDAGIKDLFEEDKHFVFHDINNAAKIIRYYLDHLEEMERIASAGKAEAVRHNKYSDRVEKILETIADRKEYYSERKNKYLSYKINIQQSLVYSHRSFKLHGESKREFRKALNKNKLMSIMYIVRFSFHRFLERIDKLFKKNF